MDTIEQRETRTVTTPGGHAVVCKAYLTGREANALKEVLFAGVKVSTEGTPTGEISGTLVLDQERKGLELIVVSLDGTTENVLERLLDLPESEYAAVVDAVNQIRVPFKKEN